MRGPGKLKFGGLLGNKLQYGHVKFGGNRRLLTFNVPQKKAQNADFWAYKPQNSYFPAT